MRRAWKAEHADGGRFRIRRRVCWVGAPVLVGLAATAGGGSVDRFWDRFAVWLWGTARLAPATVFGAAVISVVLALLWRASR